MRIYIVRHGETKANVDGYLQGWTDDPLNENGIKLARLTGQGLKGIRFDHCITSPLVRAKDTAIIILHESGNDIDIQEDERIKEINFGDYELIDTEAPEIKGFFSDPFNFPQFPNGESVQMVMRRTQDFLRDLFSRDDGIYLVLTHGCALRAMLNCFYMDRSDYWHGHVPYNCCVNILEKKNNEVNLVADDKVYYSSKMINDYYKQ